MHKNPAQLPEELLKVYDRPLCVVTGGSSGIGLATAKTFAANGYNVLICGRNQERLDNAVKQIQDAGDTAAICLAQSFDLIQANSVSELAQLALDFGRVDVLVNNAGAAPLAPIDEMDPDVIQSTLDLNTRAPYLLTRAVWAQMKQQGSGVVINISSLAAVDPFPGFSLYGATKAFMDTFSKALGNEGAEHGIRCYSIRPGAVDTPMLRALFPEFPMDQTVGPQDIADKIWACVSQPEQHQSGEAYPVTNQPIES